jgi:uncharacterized protein YwqG
MRSKPVLITILVAIMAAIGLFMLASRAKTQTGPVAMPSPPLPAKTQKPALSDTDFQTYLDWRAANSLPAAMLVPNGPAPATPGGNRIGGPVWLADGEDWPKGRDGKPLNFLAQVDFSAMPPIPDYPTSGILQFFIGSDDLYGADFEEPRKGDFKVIWRETMAAPGKLHTRVIKGIEAEDYSPVDPKVAATGVALKPRAVAQQPSISDWFFNRDLKALSVRQDIDRIYDYEEANSDTSYGHHVGGHLTFTQSDYREMESYRDHDRVLLQLWSDKAIMWGDSGQGNFSITRDDLIKRDFSRVAYHWDCY